MSDPKSGSSGLEEKVGTTSNLIDACVQLFVIHNMPKELMDTEAFQCILEMIPRDAANVLDVPDSYSKFRDIVLRKANSMEEDIKAQIKGKLVYLNLDLAFCNPYIISSVRVCFIEKCKMKNLLLTSKRWQAEELELYKSQIVNLCKKYEISQQQVLALIVDFDGYMIEKSDFAKVSITGEVHDKITQEDHEFYVTPPSTLVLHLKSKNRKETVDIHLEDCPFDVIRSARSVLRLAFDDIFSNDTQTSRAWEKFFPFLPDLNEELHRNPKWSEVVGMSRDLLRTKVFRKDSEIEEEVGKQTSYWENIEAAVGAFDIIEKNTKCYKNEVLVFGDIYKKWQICLMELEKSDNNFVIELRNSMKNRLNLLLNYEIFLASLYIDPRHNKQLTEIQIGKARKYLMKIYNKIQVIDNPERDESAKDHHLVIEQANTMQEQVV